MTKIHTDIVSSCFFVFLSVNVLTTMGASFSSEDEWNVELIFFFKKKKTRKPWRTESSRLPAIPIRMSLPDLPWERGCDWLHGVRGKTQSGFTSSRVQYALLGREVRVSGGLCQAFNTLSNWPSTTHIKQHVCVWWWWWWSMCVCVCQCVCQCVFMCVVCGVCRVCVSVCVCVSECGLGGRCEVTVTRPRR